MKKKIYFAILLMIMFWSFAQEAFSDQQKINAASQDINTTDLNEAKKAAEKYFDLIKAKEYEEAVSKFFYVPSDYSQTEIEEEKKAGVEMMRIYNEELGDIINYSYGGYEWEGAGYWTSGRIDPASLTLIYEIQYVKDKVDTTIKIVKQDNELKVTSFGINYPPTSEGMQKQMRLFKRIEEFIKKKKEK